MKSYILRGVDAALRQRLSEAGVVFSEWQGNDIYVEEPQLAQALQILNATATEKATEYENMVECTLTYGQTVVQTGTQPQLPNTDPAYVKARQAYMKASSARLKETLDKAAAALKARRDAMLPLQNKMFSLSRHVFVKGDKAQDAAVEQRHREEYRKMVEIPHVLGVRVTRDTLMVYTDTIYATAPGGKERHELGKFMFMIRIDGFGEQPFRMYNLTRRVDTIREQMNAPHVYSDGVGMAADVQETLIELIAQFEFAVATELAIQFLETVNEDEPGSYLNRWPVEHRGQPGDKQ